jgi:endonuclease YncB( thermonuclease family)
MIVTSIIGCVDGFIGLKSIPTPIAENFPYEMEGAKTGAIAGGDNFEVLCEGRLHYLVLQGIDSPKPGQDFFYESRKHVTDLLKSRTFRVLVFGLDDEKREIARVFVDDLDVNLEMARAGAAWFDGDEFEDSEKFKAAEQSARDRQIGLWKNPHPVHPSEFNPKPKPGS